MKIISWNVNGLRSIVTKQKDGTKNDKFDPFNNVLMDLINDEDPDILCLQETRCPESFDVVQKLDLNVHGYIYHKMNIAAKPGYSGTAVLSKTEPVRELDPIENDEGRMVALEFSKFYLVNVYVPNSKPDLSRLMFRTEEWESGVRKYISKLDKPVVFLGDLNVAPTELDIHNAKGNEKSHGFTIQERTAFARLVKECSLVDTFRELHPNERKYSWYSNFGQARKNNKGWRIDIILVSKKISKHIRSAEILNEYMGSDHVPVSLEIKAE